MGWRGLPLIVIPYLLMKSSLFVTFSSLFLMTWLGISYVTTLKPEPRLGRGSLPLSAQKTTAPRESEDTTMPAPMLAKKSKANVGY